MRLGVTLFFRGVCGVTGSLETLTESVRISGSTTKQLKIVGSLESLKGKRVEANEPGQWLPLCMGESFGIRDAVPFIRFSKD